MENFENYFSIYTIRRFYSAKFTPQINLFFMKSTKFLIPLLALALSSCTGLRYTNYGKPLDFIHAKSHKAAPVKVEDNETNKSNRSTVETVAGKKAQGVKTQNNRPLLTSVEVPVVSEKGSLAFVETPQEMDVIDDKHLTDESTAFETGIAAKNFPKDKRSPMMEDILLVLLCIFIPPLAVYLIYGISTEFWIDLILVFVFFIPAIIYAFIVCF